ncbi:MAG: TIGR00153 family protein [Gammaproteobacteria bacterium]|nr:TIGR00153 family protein [Gammaproteobacteria bacterium]
MKSSSVFNVFGRSPISPLQEHMDKVYKCVRELSVFLQEALREDWDAASSAQKTVVKLEKDADLLKRDIRMHLPKSLFMPVARTDVLELLIAQDSVANKAQDIAGLIIGRKIVFPKEVAAKVVDLLDKSIAATKLAHKAIGELSELLEAGFRGAEVEIVKNLIRKLDELENEADSAQKLARRELFKIEKEMHPLDAMFLYKTIEWVGDLADKAQHVGGKLQILLAR